MKVSLNITSRLAARISPSKFDLGASAKAFCHLFAGPCRKSRTAALRAAARPNGEAVSSLKDALFAPDTLRLGEPRSDTWTLSIALPKNSNASARSLHPQVRNLRYSRLGSLRYVRSNTV